MDRIAYRADHSCAVVAGVALRVRYGCGQAVNGLLRIEVGSRCMAGSTACKAMIWWVRQGFNREVAYLTIFREGSDRW